MPQKPALAAKPSGMMSQLSPNSRPSLCTLPSSVGIAVESLDRSFAFYSIRAERLERIQDHEREWTELTPQDILQHLVLGTPVAVWLENRIVLRPVDWVRPHLHPQI
jgi:hypothetical protein